MSAKRFIITDDGSHTIFLPDLNETYHSTHGAIQESEYVFIQKGLAYFCESAKTEKVKVFEVGFGTGLNVLLSSIYADLNSKYVDYHTIEAYPLEIQDIKQLNYSEQLSAGNSYELSAKIHEAKWGEKIAIAENFQLTKYRAKIEDFSTSESFDVCFFDAFAPSKQAEMWEKSVLKQMHSILEGGGIFVTYCAKGQLKRDLRSIGFEVETLPGPPGKKEMVRAIKK